MVVALFKLVPYTVPLTHAVESSLTKIPQIVERESSCGCMRMHVPVNVPDTVQIEVIPVPNHCHDVPKGLVVGKAVVMQGVIVRNDGVRMLLSHGGLLMSISGVPNLASIGEARQLVRTSLTF